VTKSLRQPPPNKYTLEAVNRWAQQFKIKCISKDYKDIFTPLEWECELNKHTWIAKFSTMKSRATHGDDICHKCRSEFPIHSWSLIGVQHFGQKYGLECLSKNYSNQHEFLEWQCIKGHKSKISLDVIIRRLKRSNRPLCTECFNNTETRHFVHSTASLQELAVTRNGSCLLTEDRRITYKDKIPFKCNVGHIWTTTLFSIKKGCWCPECPSKSLGEKICRAFLEQLFEKPFPKTRPIWLIGIKGHGLELDGYCADLNFAFEHQGLQHYNQTNFFHKDSEEFSTLQANDLKKVELCKANKVSLLCIPQLTTLTPLNKLKDIIKIFCNENNIKMSENFDTKKIDLTSAYN